MKGHRIIFMGTPPFAVASLNALVQGGIDVAAVVTAPDRPAGRGQQLRSSAVKERALELGLPVLQPEKLKAPEFHAQLDAFGASLYIVVAFRMLPEVVWDRPAMGTINLHASLLPDYRGAAPLNWAVINGETVTGVTTFFIQQAIDTGDLLLRKEIPIGPDETAGELHDRAMLIGGELLTRTVKDVFDGTVERQPQSAFVGDAVHHAPKLDPSNCRIDATRKAKQVHDHIRGLSPLPAAWAKWIAPEQPPTHFKVLRSRIHDRLSADEAGTLSVEDGRLLLQCADGRVELLEVQPEGKRRMTATELVRGLRRTDGLRLG
ncbi:MAG TPA: methionyl-tRNA formyltransferase [Flavobacteriales bacterium]